MLAETLLAPRLTRQCLRALLLGLALAATTTVAWSADPARPFPQRAVYAPGTLLPSHRTQQQLDQDARALYDAWKQRYLVQAGTESDGHPRWRVRTAATASARTVSEGMGYGMIIVALMGGHDPDAQRIFDGLLEFRKDHPSSIDARLMDWSVPADESDDGASTGNDSAFDGDADMAYGLLLAEAQWGNLGRFDYAAERNAVLAGILARTIGPSSRLPMLGDWVSPNGSTYNQWTPRTSDFMTGHFRAFARATGEAAWTQVVAAVQAGIASLQSGYSPTTGLLPDFARPVSSTDRRLRPAGANFLEGANDGQYYYNAGRDPWRIALDALHFGDSASRVAAQKMSVWIRSATSGVPANIKAGYALNGTPLSGSNYFTTFFAAPFGVAAMLDTGGQAWLNAVYEAVRTSNEGYYEDSLSLLSLLVMGGHWWDPTGPTPGNHSPVAQNDAATTAEDTAVTTAVLANDSDPDGDTLVIASVSSPARGTATISGSTILYRPAANTSGADSFGYTVSDGRGGTAGASVAVTVSAVNDAPVARADSASVRVGGSVTVPVLANDSDVEGDTLTVVSVTQGSNGGSVTTNGTTATYRPAAGLRKRLTDRFNYTVSDGRGGSATATVTVSVRN